MWGEDICGYLWIAFCAIWLVMALRTKPTQQRESISSRLSYTVFVIAGAYLVFGKEVAPPWLRIHLFQTTLFTDGLGVALTAAGIGFAVWARLYLGSNWSGTVTVKVGHELVRTGPYRWVRHPIYTGLIVALLGTALQRAQVRGLIALVLLYVGFKLKSRIEERAMIDTFGTEYDQYSRTTGAIIPKLRP
jgi:protein-S-isoprenylcysteine O-methyltransferase Ste14